MDTAVAEPPTSPASDYSEAFAGIDAISGVDDSPAPAQRSSPEPAAAPAPAPEPAAPITRQNGLLDDDLPAKAVPKPAEAPKPAPKTAAKTEPAKVETNSNGKRPSDDFKLPKPLRDAYDKAVEEKDRLTAEIAETKKQVEAAKRSGEEAAEARFKSDLEALKKEREDLESTVRYTDFTKSKEYNAKYREPINKIWDRFDKEIKDFKIETDEGEVPVTREHLWELVRMNAMQASRVATERFGAAAPEILNYRRQLRDLHEQKDAAVEEWRTKGSELAAQQAKQAEERSKSVASLLDSEVKALRTERADLFTPDPNDEEEKESSAKSNRTIDAAFYGKGRPDGVSDNLWQETIVKAQAHVMARAANFGVIALRNKRQSAEIEALKLKLSKFEKSEPGDGDPGRVIPAKPLDMSAEDGIDMIPGV